MWKNYIKIHFIGTKTFQNHPQNKNILSTVWGSNDPQNKNLEPQKKFRRSNKKKRVSVKEKKVWLLIIFHTKWEIEEWKWIFVCMVAMRNFYETNLHQTWTGYFFNVDFICYLLYKRVIIKLMWVKHSSVQGIAHTLD